MLYETLKDQLVDQLRHRKRATFTFNSTLSKLRADFPEYRGTETFYLRSGRDRFYLAFFSRDDAWESGEIYSENQNNLNMLYTNLLHVFHALHLELKIPFTLLDPQAHLPRLGLAGLLELNADEQIEFLKEQITQNEKIIPVDFPLMRLSRELNGLLNTEF